MVVHEKHIDRDEHHPSLEDDSKLKKEETATQSADVDDVHNSSLHGVNADVNGTPTTARGEASSLTSSETSTILGVCVVDFVCCLLIQNHLVGPQVEYAYPRALLENEEMCSRLPFLALPDGSHLVCGMLIQSEEDFCYFHMLCESLYPETIFGISCNRQINADALINKGAQVTRSMVQKAIVILATRVSAPTYPAYFWLSTRKAGHGYPSILRTA